MTFPASRSRHRSALAAALVASAALLAACDRPGGGAPTAAAPPSGAATSVPPGAPSGEGGGERAAAGGTGRPTEAGPAGAPAAGPAASPWGGAGSAGAPSTGAAGGASGGTAGGTGAGAGPGAGGAGGAPGGARPGGGPGGPVTVTTVRAERRDMPVTVEATGSVVAVSSIEIKPQISSVVTRVHVREGQFVKSGELLFTLDARADEANVAKLQAQVVRDQTSLAELQRQLARNRELLERNFVSKAVVDTSQSQVDSQVAAVAADRAAVDAARVPLNYSRIVAPSAGRVGIVAVWPGSAVIANQTTLLTVTQIDPIDVAFSVPQRHLQDVLAALATGRATVSGTLPDGQKSLTGKLVFVDNAIDAASGTVKVKARFGNAPSLLWPGAFVRASLELGTIDDAVIVPQASVIRGARGPFVYVVVDGKAAPRPIELVGSRGDDAAVRGVRPGEPVVLDGRQNLRPGSPVVEQQGGPARGPRVAGTGPDDRRSAP